MNKWKPFKSAGEVIHKVGNQKNPEKSKHYSLYQEALTEQGVSSVSNIKPLQSTETSQKLIKCLEESETSNDFHVADPQVAQMYRDRLTSTLLSIYKDFQEHLNPVYYDFKDEGEDAGLEGEKLESYIEDKMKEYSEDLLDNNQHYFLNQDDEDYGLKIEVINAYREELLHANPQFTKDYFYQMVSNKNFHDAKRFSKETK